MVSKIHRSDHPDLLVDALCDVISVPLDDPFATEVIAVPSRGIDRWLTQRIASTFEERGIGDGIAANIDFPFPYRLVSDVLSQIPETQRSVEAWSKRQVVSHLQQIIDEHRDDEWMWLITRFVDGPDGERSGAQRLRAAQKIERLFSAYTRYRPQMVEAWTAGDDLGPEGGAIPGEASWQPRMWRILRQQIGVPAIHEALPDALDLLRSGRVELNLPQRVSIYGVTAIDPVNLAVLEALGGFTDVHLFVLYPSDELWQSVAPLVQDEIRQQQAERRDADPSTDRPVHPLLRSWGQESRELQLVLGNSGSVDDDVRSTPDSSSETLLETLQHDIRANRVPSRTAAGPDRSIQIYGCHGPQRQVEVLRDAVLHLLSADETLEPRDVVIMTPDIETYAPLVEAAFGGAGEGREGLPDLRVRIADRSPLRGNPLIRIAKRSIELAGSRVRASTVAELLAVPEVQRKFRISSDEVGEMTDLVDDANIRWGFDAMHRDREGVGPRDEHTWRRGIDRTLAGVFFEDDPQRIVADVAPLAQVEGQAANAAGKLAQVVERLSAVAETLSVPVPTSEWANRVGTAVRLLAEPDRGDEWQWASMERLLAETFPMPAEDASDPVIDLDEAMVLVDPWGEDRPSHLHHRTGDVTVCTLVPMRSVPYRVVCLVGMEHDRFPRSPRSDGDDLLLGSDAVGDRDRAAEDRQLLLDALMAAGDYFVVTYTGRDPLTNTNQPLAVPIAELYEVIEMVAGVDDAKRNRTDHPLQSFSPDIFTDNRLGVEGPWGYDPVQFAGATVLAQRVIDGETESGPSLAPVKVEPPTLGDLIKYLANPSATYLRNSLGMFIPGTDDTPDDELPIALNGLEQWSVTTRLLDGISSGHDEEALIAHERGSDTVPAGELADGILDDALALARRLDGVARERGWKPGTAVPFAGTVEIDGREFSGSVLGDPEEALVADVSPSRPKASRWTSLYARVAFLSALEPARPWRGLLVAKRDNKGALTAVTIGPFGEEPHQRQAEGQQRLAELVHLHSEGMAIPLPLFPETSLAWQAAKPDGRRNKAKSKWLGYERGGVPGERDDPSIGVLFPHLFEPDDLFETDFERYAELLWSPIVSVSNEETVRPAKGTV